MVKRAKGVQVVGFLFAVMILLVSAMAFAGDAISIVGEINDDFLIVTDSGETYEVMMSDQGIELIDHVGERVEVMGEIIGEAEDRLINVLSYEVLGADEEEEEESIEESSEKSVQEKQ